MLYFQVRGSQGQVQGAQEQSQPGVQLQPVLRIPPRYHAHRALTIDKRKIFYSITDNHAHYILAYVQQDILKNYSIVLV